MRSLACLVLVACGSPPSPPPRAESPPPTTPAGDAALFDARAVATWTGGCFAIRDRAGNTHTSDAARCAERRRPFSTFKIANALIALDAGILAGADAAMTWDRRRVPDEPWYTPNMREPHTLRTGIAASAVPYFRTLALQIGAERMQAALVKLGYGNAEVTPLDRAWLPRGKLAISALEQLAFVDALARRTLPVSQRAQEIVGEITVLARDGDRVLHGKTGSGPQEDRDGWLVWQVGWVTTPDGVVSYAAWIDSDAATMTEARAERDARLRAMLATLGVFSSP